MKSLPQLLLACAMAFPSLAVAQSASSDAIVSEDFESTPVGSIPEGWGKTGSVAVVDTQAHSGHHCLQINPAVHGPRLISLPADKVAALGGDFWGRFYYKVQTPIPSPLPRPGKKALIIHTTLVSGKAESPLSHDQIEVRPAGILINAAGKFHYLFNVQPKGRPEFGAHGPPTHTMTGEWTLVEFHVSSATQSWELYLDGASTPEVSFSHGAGNFEKSELPPQFETLSVGWTNYQSASGKGFTAWIDDIAFGKSRLGPASQ
jgi:hypothetical protein